jgi:hypothetical protein
MSRKSTSLAPPAGSSLPPLGGALLAVTVAVVACTPPRVPFDPTDPARGPGRLVEPRAVSPGDFAGPGDVDPAPAPRTPPGDGPLPACDAACRAHCDALGLSNPLDAAVCPTLWGVGRDTLPIVPEQACRRLWADFLGRFPSRDEARAKCEGRPWGEVVRALIADPAFVAQSQRRWADELLYNNQVVSVERLYDMDRLVGLLYRGELAYDEFAAVVSAHPVLTRRYATAGDRAEKAFHLFLGRPPFENERSDLARLYGLWENGYHDHAALGMRLPDAVIRYRCTGERGQPDEGTRGECTSVLWGHNELILTPDIRAQDGRMWSGLLRSEEWERLQAPGRVLARGERAFWEHAANQTLRLLLGYDLGTQVPAALENLVEYFLRYGGDIRALHYAVATSQIYLQSALGETPAPQRWAVGPLKQAEVETWIDTISTTTGYELSRCDHRLPQPEAFLREGAFGGHALVEASAWELAEGGDGVVANYRDLARTLGGCPENEIGGRFKTISILTTATQQGFVGKVCNPGSGKERAAPVAALLPPGLEARTALTPEHAAAIFDHQVGLFFGRAASEEELADARGSAGACTPAPCTAESFARPVCYALLSSGEVLFY